MIDKFTKEEKRIRFLSTKNRNIREEEIAIYPQKRGRLEEYLLKSELRLDSIRVMIGI